MEREELINNISETLLGEAVKYGLYIDSEELMKHGAFYYFNESMVFVDYKNSKVIKLKDLFKFTVSESTIKDSIYYHILQNIYFPEAGYKLLGITEVNNRVRLVLEQPYIKGANVHETELEKYMVDKGFVKDGSVYTYGQEVTVFDLDSTNIVLGEDNNIYVIDPVFRVFRGKKTNILDIIEKYLDKKPVLEEAKKLAILCPDLEKTLINNGYSVDKKTVEEEKTVEPMIINFYSCSPGKVFIRKSDNFIMGTSLSLGVSDSMDNYREDDIPEGYVETSS